MKHTFPIRHTRPTLEHTHFSSECHKDRLPLRSEEQVSSNPFPAGHPGAPHITALPGHLSCTPCSCPLPFFVRRVQCPVR